jgi:hypothetical protein
MAMSNPEQQNTDNEVWTLEELGMTKTQLLREMGYTLEEIARLNFIPSEWYIRYSLSSNDFED